MKVYKVAMILANRSPVPAVRGGATENMITHLIEVNEIVQQLDLVVYSAYNEEAQSIANTYQHTKVNYYHGNQRWEWLSELPFRFLRKATGGHSYIRTNFVRWCARDIRQKDFDCVIIEGNYFQTLQLRKATTNTLILHMHIDGLNTQTDNGKNILHACAGVIAISEYCKNRIIEIDPAQKDKVHVLKNMIDVQHFTQEGHQAFRDSLRLKHGIEPDDKVFVFCGRVDETKGVKELVEAFIALNDPTTHLFIIGSSVFKDGKKTAYVRNLEKLAAGYRNIVFFGYIDQAELPKYYSSADISVVPSITQEAAGNVIPESLACGLPVIATKRGGIPEYADPSACILLDCDTYLVQRLKDAMERLVADQAFYTEKKANARAIALQYDKHIYYENLYDLLGKIL